MPKGSGLSTKKRPTITDNSGNVKKPENMVNLQCACCGQPKREDNFYSSRGSRLWKEGSVYKALLCKECIDALMDELRDRFGEKLALMMICHLLDWPFMEKVYKNLAAKNSVFTVGLYARAINCPQYSSKSFFANIFEMEKLIREGGLDNTSTEEERSWTKQENKNRKEVIELLGYNPFEGYSTGDQRVLFGELIKYCDDDSLEDPYKLSAIIQIITNNHQIRQYDIEIAKTDPIKYPERIKNLQELKAKLISANNNTAKENEISVKNRSNKDVGKSTLTYLMRDLRQKDFKKAEANYYDQLRSEGTQWAIDMSNKAIQQNAMFDENDKQEMFNIQRSLIQDLQAKLDDEMERSRLLTIERDDLRRQLQERDDV